MNVLILGFNNEFEIDKEMEKLIAESDCFLFNVCIGGLRSVGSDYERTAAEKYAIMRGAPLNRIVAENINKLTWLLCKEVDFVLAKMTEGTPQWQKNLVMKLKSEGKHGKIVY